MKVSLRHAELSLPITFLSLNDSNECGVCGVQLKCELSHTLPVTMLSR